MNQYRVDIYTHYRIQAKDEKEAQELVKDILVHDNEESNMDLNEIFTFKVHIEDKNIVGDIISI